jgi:hypothetical protein
MITVILVLFLQFSPEVNLRFNWTSTVCPIHNETMIKAKVNCVAGGDLGMGKEGVAYGEFNAPKPPYTVGEFPNAKFKFRSSGDCVNRCTKALIYYCKTCEKKRKKLEN